MAPSQSLVLLITRPMVGSGQKEGCPRAYSQRLPDEFVKLSFKSKTHATWTHERISNIFTQP